LIALAQSDSIKFVSKRHDKTLNAIFTVPTLASLKFGDIEKLLLSYGAVITEGRGSQISFELRGHKLFLHRPHPEKEAMKYQVEAVRDFLILIGISNG